MKRQERMVFKGMSAKLRNSIQESFLNLALRKPVDRITVKEIVKDCDINRNSFYYHFEDLPDLIEKVVEERIFNIDQVTAPDKSIEDCSFSIVQAIVNNQELIRNIYNSKSRALFERKLFVVTGKLVRQYLDNNVFPSYDISRSDREVLIRLYRNMLAGYILEWLNASPKDDLLAQLQRIFELRRGFFEITLERAVIDHRTGRKK